jgi:hypothetical protein
VILVLAAVAILGGVVLAALGQAGEMTVFSGDYAPLDLGEVSATDVALLRPPRAVWGYNVQATEDSLHAIAQSVSARDVEIATLRRELAELRARGVGTRAGQQAQWHREQRSWGAEQPTWGGEQPTWAGEQPTWGGEQAAGGQGGEQLAWRPEHAIGGGEEVAGGEEAALGGEGSEIHQADRPGGDRPTRVTKPGAADE